jgi:hypothetical protein
MGMGASLGCPARVSSSRSFATCRASHENSCDCASRMPSPVSLVSMCTAVGTNRVGAWRVGFAELVDLKNPILSEWDRRRPMEKSILLLGPSTPSPYPGWSKASDCIEAMVLQSTTVSAHCTRSS